jgi:hypothetical protein
VSVPSLCACRVQMLPCSQGTTSTTYTQLLLPLNGAALVSLAAWLQDSAVDPETGQMYNPKQELPLVFESLRKLWSADIAEAQRQQQLRPLGQQQSRTKQVGQVGGGGQSHCWMTA